MGKAWFSSTMQKLGPSCIPCDYQKGGNPRGNCAELDSLTFREKRLRPPAIENKIIVIWSLSILPERTEICFNPKSTSLKGSRMASNKPRFRARKKSNPNGKRCGGNERAERSSRHRSALCGWSSANPQDPTDLIQEFGLLTFGRGRHSILLPSRHAVPW
jgi:hypothetical protein